MGNPQNNFYIPKKPFPWKLEKTKEAVGAERRLLEYGQLPGK